MLHHYLEFMDEESVAEAERCSLELSALYAELECQSFDKNSTINNSYSDGNGNSDGDDSDMRQRQAHRSVRTPTLFPSF